MKRLDQMTLEELWELFPISLVPHNPEWEVWGKEEIHILEGILKDFSPLISHIGSTAIPGIFAKPTVDILIEIPYSDVKAWQEIMRGGLSKVSPEADISKPGLTPNVPSWAGCAKDSVGIILETASPAKFGQTVKLATGKEPALPERLERVMHLPDNSVPMENDYAKFRAWLEENLR